MGTKKVTETMIGVSKAKSLADCIMFTLITQLAGGGEPSKMKTSTEGRVGTGLPNRGCLFRFLSGKYVLI
jgi:hypothetical protein